MSDILGMLQEVDLLTDGVNLSSLNRAAALKLGDEFEKYVKEKSQEMIESAKVVTNTQKASWWGPLIVIKIYKVIHTYIIHTCMYR